MSDGVQIQINLTNTELDIKLTQIALAVGDLTKPFKMIGFVVAENVRLGFRETKDPYGNKWASIRPRDPKPRGNIEGNDKPLIDTGILRNSITFNSDKLSTRIGTNISYAEYHQLGTRDITARPFLPAYGLPKDWSDEIMTILDSYLAAVI